MMRKEFYKMKKVLLTPDIISGYRYHNGYEFQGKYTTPSLLHRLPSEVRDHFKMLTSLQKDLRPSADQLRSISFFQSGMRSLLL